MALIVPVNVLPAYRKFSAKAEISFMREVHDQLVEIEKEAKNTAKKHNELLKELGPIGDLILLTFSISFTYCIFPFWIIKDYKALKTS